VSLRARLLFGMALVAVVLGVVTVSITRSTEDRLVAQVDEQLGRAAPQFRGPGPGEGNPTGPPSSLYVADVDPTTGQFETEYLPATTRSSASPPDLTAQQVLDHSDGVPWTVKAKGSDLRYRAVVRSEGRGGEVRLYALPLEDVDATVSRLITIQALAAAAIAAVLGLVTFWVLRLGVRPIRRMTHTALAIGQGDLSQRIPESDPRTEAGELGVALNEMLARIEEAFDERTRSEGRLRQFVADASHELRTPVTTIRGYAELYRMGGLTTDEQVSEAMRRTEQEATRMGQLVADLLDLARMDQGRPLQRAPLDLSTLAADAAADARAVEPARPIELDAPEPVEVLGDEPLLRQIIANLLGNVRVHTPPDAPVAVRVRRAVDRAVLEVADQGPGMAPEVAARAFERFFRADPSRSRQHGGSGLGLAIVASTVAAHGGTVAIDSEPGRGTTVRVELPLGPGPGGAGRAASASA
jgi:two-component system OmpR family sensor kinase